jgi:predicted MFS family arabinose efflux permease
VATDGLSAPQPTGHHRQITIGALGVVQIFTWGTSFYLPAVLAAPIAEDTGWPLSGVVGGLSLGLFAAALISPRVGKAVHKRGGRPVLAIAVILLAAGLTTLALAPVLPVYLAGWLLLGLGMGCGLYDPAFATLGRLYGAEARPAITTLTLWGGFASTVCWPLSAFLVQQLGWRGACFAYASLHLALILPLILLFIPRPPPPVVEKSAGPDTTGALTGRDRLLFLLFGGVLMLGGAIMTMVSVHLITLLQARDVSLAAAVSFGALIGPAQVGTRIVEMSLKGRHHPLWTLTAAFSLIGISLLLLASGLPWVGLWLILYGAGNGIYSISRGTVPLALFDPARYPVLIGRLARPGLVAQAIAPAIGAIILSEVGANTLLWILLGLAVCNCGLIGGLWRVRAN